MRDATSNLTSLGFSDAEARAYTHLLAAGPSTGYQLARAAGIPRPNVYPVLDRLEARGVVVRLQGGGSLNRYEALPAEKMLERIAAETGRRLEEARSAFAALASPSRPSDSVWNLEGRAAVIARAAALIDAAEGEVLAGLWAAEADDLAAPLAAAVARGIRVTTLCIQGCAEECAGCAGEVYRFPLNDPRKPRWLVVTADAADMLVAQLGDTGYARGVGTALAVVNGLAAEYLRNAIAASEIVRSLGPGLAAMLDARAQRAVESAGLSSGGRTWLERLFAATALREESNA